MNATDLATLMSRCFNAGNYAQAYETPNRKTAWAHHRPEGVSFNSQAGLAAFVLGFYSSYELHEMSDCAQDEYMNAAALMQSAAYADAWDLTSMDKVWEETLMIAERRESGE